MEHGDPEIRYTLESYTPGRFVIEMKHRVTGQKKYIGAVPEAGQEGSYINEMFDRLKDARRYPFDCDQAATAVILSFPNTRNIEYAVIEADKRWRGGGVLLFGEWDAEFRNVRWRYVSRIPCKPLRIGTVLVHNHVAPQPILGMNGFRAWTQWLTDELEVCKCDWAGVDLHGLAHYRYRVNR